MAYDIGPKIGIDGEAEFRRAIQNINTNIKTLGTEMLAVTSAYDANDKSVAALTSRNEVLVKQIDAQKEKLAKLQEGIDASAAKYGENDEKTQRWQQTVNKATADLNQMERELDSNNKELEKQGDAFDKVKEKAAAFGSGLATAAKAAAAGIAAVTAAAGAMVGAVVKGVSSVAEYGDNIDKMSQKLGMSAEAYQEWDFILQHTGTSSDSMQSSMKTLASAAETDKDAFKKLGISQEQLAGMSQEDLFSATIAALQNVSNETERTYLASQLLGKGATELGPLLNTSASDIEAMRQQVHDLGGVMSNESVAASAAFQDSLQNLQTSLKGLSRGALADFLPAMTQVMDGLTGLLSGDTSGLDLISQGLDEFVASLSATLPQMLETGQQIVESLLGAIVENLPQMIESGASVLMEFSTGILGMLPELTSAALEVVTTLAAGISSSLPELVPSVVDTVLQIVDTLTDPDNLDNVITAALEIITALAEGLIKALPKLAERVPQIIANIVTTLASNLPKITESALKIISTLASGLIQAIPTLVANIPQIISAIADTITAFNWLNLGKKIIDFFAQGIKGMLSAVTSAAEDVIKSITDGGGLKNLPQMALKWGKDMLDNFIKGIKDKISAVKDAVSNVAGTVKSFLGFSEPEKGPLSNFHTYAPDMMELFAKGIKDNAGLLESAFNNSLGEGFSDAMGTAKRRIDRSMKELAGNASADVKVSGNVAGQTSGGIDSYLAQLPELIAAAVHKELEGMAVNLNLRKVGEMTSQWQNNQARAMGV